MCMLAVKTVETAGTHRLSLLTDVPKLSFACSYGKMTEFQT